VSAFSVPGLHCGGDTLRVGVFSCNIGNAMPDDLGAWIPLGGGEHDVSGEVARHGITSLHAAFVYSSGVLSCEWLACMACLVLPPVYIRHYHT
jgi:hypothetical protein